MNELTVSVDTRQLRRALADLGAKAPTAIMRALNRTAGTARTQAVREVAKEIRLPQKNIRPMIPLIPATRSVLTAKLIARGWPISLMRLGARQTRAGVIYRSPAGPVLIPGAFIARMPQGGRGVFKRIRPSERRSKGAWSLNLPIDKLRGPSVPQIVLEKGIFVGIAKTSQETLAKNLAHETEYLLSKRQSRG